MTKTVTDLHSSGKKINKLENEKTPHAIVLQRIKNEAINKIISDTKNFKVKKQNELKNQRAHIYSFYETIKKEKEENMKEMQDMAKYYRRKRFLEIFESIKMKVRESVVKLPDVKLDNKNVYSRLYHNVVYFNRETNAPKENKNLKLLKLDEYYCIE
jgi:hypothetical protein